MTVGVTVGVATGVAVEVLVAVPVGVAVGVQLGDRRRHELRRPVDGGVETVGGELGQLLNAQLLGGAGAGAAVERGEVGCRRSAPRSRAALASATACAPVKST